MWLDILVLVIFALGMVGIAVYTRNKAKNSSDFLMAGKGLNGWMSAFAYGTTYFSAVIFVGYAGQFGQAYGLSATWIGIFNAVLGALVAWLLLAKPTKNTTTRLQVKTMPSFFGKRYESKGLRGMSAVIVFIFLIPYGASVYNGLSALFQIVFGIDGWIIILAMAVITGLYICVGGYLATSLSDFIQGLIMLVGVIIMTVFMLNSDYVNWGEGIKTLMQNDHGWFITVSHDNVPWLFDNTATLISLIILTSVGVYGLPQTVHKYYTVRDKKAIKQGVIVSTAFALIIGFCAYFTGALGSLFEGAIDLSQTGNIIPNMVKLVIPAGLLGLIAVLILSASMSTLGSVTLSASSVISVDLYQGFSKKEIGDKKITLTTRIVCFAFILISIAIALINYFFNIAAITSLMSFSWGTLSGCFLGPFVIGLRSKKVTKTASYVSMIGTLILTVALIIVFGYWGIGWEGSFGAAIKSGVSRSAQIGVICMAYSLISTFIVSLFTKKPSEETLYQCFDKECEGLVK